MTQIQGKQLRLTGTTISALQQRLDIVEGENDQLRERVRQLEEKVGMHHPIPVELNLTGSEARVLGFLLGREMVTKDAIYDALYGHLPDVQIEFKIIDVFICKLRKKLNPFGLHIMTVWGQGCYLTKESQSKLRDMMKAAAA